MRVSWILGAPLLTIHYAPTHSLTSTAHGSGSATEDGLVSQFAREILSLNETYVNNFLLNTVPMPCNEDEAAGPLHFDTSLGVCNWAALANC